MLEEDVVYMTADQPEEHLIRAHEDLVKNNAKAAASELRLAAGYIRMQESRPGMGKQVLDPWSTELRTLAAQVAEGKAKQQDVLKAAGGASYALAKGGSGWLRSASRCRRFRAGFDLGRAKAAG
jgi:hypothetical protein